MSEQFVNYPRHLQLVDDAKRAKELTERHLELARERHSIKFIVSCNRVLGDLAADADDHVTARRHSDLARQTVRGTTDRKILIDTLIARGKWVITLA